MLKLSIISTVLWLSALSSVTYCQTNYKVTKKSILAPDNIQDSYHIFFRHDGSVDSICRTTFKLGIPEIVYTYSGWRSAPESVLPGRYHNIDIHFQQLSFDTLLPRWSKTEYLSGSYVGLVQFDTFYFTDDLLRYHIQLSHETNGMVLKTINEFQYNERRDMIRHTGMQFPIDDSMGTVYPDEWARYEYDGEGRITTAVRSLRPVGLNPPIDSQLFHYNADQLVSTTVYRVVNGQVSSATQFHYTGWQKFQRMRYPFFQLDRALNFHESLLGGEDFRSASAHEWIGGSTFSDEPSRTSIKDYESHGELIRDSVIYDDGTFDATVFSRYPNGDLAQLGYNVNGELSANWQWRNTYETNGRILISDSYDYGKPGIRYEFDYGTLNVNQVITETSSRIPIGRSFTLPLHGAQSIQVSNLIGVSLFGSTKVGSHVDLPPSIPSGLYFISIDGGKPRKHLIP